MAFGLGKSAEVGGGAETAEAQSPAIDLPIIEQITIAVDHAVEDAMQRQHYDNAYALLETYRSNPKTYQEKILGLPALVDKVSKIPVLDKVKLAETLTKRQKGQEAQPGEISPEALAALGLPEDLAEKAKIAMQQRETAVKRAGEAGVNTYERLLKEGQIDHIILPSLSIQTPNVHTIEDLAKVFAGEYEKANLRPVPTLMPDLQTTTPTPPLETSTPAPTVAPSIEHAETPTPNPNLANSTF